MEAEFSEPVTQNKNMDNGVEFFSDTKFSWSDLSELMAKHHRPTAEGILESMNRKQIVK